VADSCNPIKLTRREWQSIAISNNSPYTDIEIICSDKGEHKKRIEERECDISGSFQPSWKQVIEREYDPWAEDIIRIDTSGKSINESFNDLLAKFKLSHNNGN
jgi:hypothetical protein